MSVKFFGSPPQKRRLLLFQHAHVTPFEGPVSSEDGTEQKWLGVWERCQSPAPMIEFRYCWAPQFGERRERRRLSRPPGALWQGLPPIAPKAHHCPGANRHPSRTAMTGVAARRLRG